MAKFGERLRHLRTLKELSQMDLAKQLKISKSSVNMYERCEREPSLEMLEKIADFFNVDLDYLLGKSECSNRYAQSIGVPRSQNQTGNPVNYIRVAGRDGSFHERTLTDLQMAQLLEVLNNLPDAPDDL